MKILIPILMLSAMCAVQAAELEAEAGPVPTSAIASDPSPDSAGMAAAPPDSVSPEVHKAAAAGDGGAVRRLLYETPQQETDLSRLALRPGAVRKPSAAGPILVVAGLAMGALGAIMVAGSEREVQRTRTVDPCWGRIDFWNVCDEPTRTETYMETETDWGRQLIGIAGVGGGIGMLFGGLITIAARNPPKSKPQTTSAALSPDAFAIAWTRSF